MILRTKITLLLGFLMLIGSLLFSQRLSPEKQAMIDELEDDKEKYISIAEKIWGHAELGFLEEKSTALLQKTLKKAGFQIKRMLRACRQPLLPSMDLGNLS